MRILKSSKLVSISQDFLNFALANGMNLCYNNNISKNTPTEREPHLENCIELKHTPFSEGDFEMATKINQPVMIDGRKCWIRANTMQEFTDKVIKLMGAETAQTPQKHPFDAYAWNWFNLYSAPNVATVTAITYKRQLTLYLLPAFEGMAVEDITANEVQRPFNSMTGAKATKDKTRMVLNQILVSAVEDGLLATNPLKSSKVKIKGEASKETIPYSVEQMRYIVQHIKDVKSPLDRTYIALQALHPLRLEEVLGLRGEDVDMEHMVIYIRRAVTHPDRNQPEVKETKTEESQRVVGLASLVVPFLPDCAPGEYWLGGERPLSYTQVRNMCERIKKDISFSENITPKRFRTTVLTDVYDQTKDATLTRQAAGHSTSATTFKHYVKGRQSLAEAAAAIERAYSV